MRRYATCPADVAAHRQAAVLVAVAVAVAVLGGACSAGGSEIASGDVPGKEVMAGLCRTAEQADDAGAAEKAFARIHTDLHLVARAIEAEDRSVAGRLLVAKRKVEDDLHRQAGASELGPHLQQLITATGDGLERLDITVVPCA
ncbi:MAG: hypothetical protein ACRDZ7_17250 [Acidimicrobiia bacterium]